MNMKRMRGRNHRPNGGGGGGGGGGFRNQQNGIPLNRNHVFDSSGPEMRVRGTAQQLYDKYQQMARDASSNGDRVTGEAYYQHAEHYFRIISAINQAQGQQGGQPNPQGGTAERGNYQPQQGNPGQGQERGDYQRREFAGNEQSELAMEHRQEPRPQEHRQHENRQEQPRRFEQRPYEQRPKPEFQRNDRQDRSERNERNDRNEQRFRPEPVVDTRIDISSALEAELAAATAELPGFGEQPVIQPMLINPAPAPAPEPRAIPIIPDAPPPAAVPEAAPVKVAKPRGRPRLVKPVPEEIKE
jgi:hypothetical protein